PEILELLVAHGARVTEVDKSGRSPLEIAKSHEYDSIIEILNKHLNIDDTVEEDTHSGFESQMTSWPAHQEQWHRSEDVLAARRRGHVQAGDPHGISTETAQTGAAVLDCLTTLGSHLLQVYILEATLQYALRQYGTIQDQLKCEPPDSPVIAKTKTASKKLLQNIT
ncbi:putative Ankyrin repeat protein, partial [Operophtera brumata]